MLAHADKEAEAEAEEPLKIGDGLNDLTTPLLASATESSSASSGYLSKILCLALVWLAFFAIQLLRGSKTTEVLLLLNYEICDSYVI